MADTLQPFRQARRHGVMPARRRGCTHGGYWCSWDLRGYGIGQPTDGEANEAAGFDRCQMERLDTAVISPEAEVHEPTLGVPCGSETNAPLVESEMPGLGG